MKNDKVEHNRAELRARMRFLLSLAALDDEAFAWLARVLVIDPGMVPPAGHCWPPIPRGLSIRTVADARHVRHHLVGQMAESYLRAFADNHRPLAERITLLVALLELDEVSLAWVARACPAAAMMTGGLSQVWPDGLGGFRDRVGIALARMTATEYVIMVNGLNVEAAVQAVDDAVPTVRTGRDG